ncbi:MAG: glucose-1-phosphate thymidylyltransferase, partial [Candidatus Latescibacterota bacterium]
ILREVTQQLGSQPDKESEIHGDVRLDEGVKIKRSILRGPCVVGSGTEIIDSYVGPFTSIGANSRIVNSEVENSIILEDCTICDIGSRIGSSLIGRNVTVERTNKPPRAYKLMVGDNSQITLY